MKRFILFSFLLVTVFTKSRATEWNGAHYNFNNFEYFASMLFGSETSKLLSDEFVLAAKINAYINNKQEAGKLKSKPFIYEIRGISLRSWRSEYLYEVYETDSTYCIGVNNFNDVPLGDYLTYKDVIIIINYMCEPDFTPVYLKSRKAKTNWVKRQPGDYEKTATNAAIYTMDSLKINLVNNQLRILWGDRDMGVKLSTPVAYPIKFKNRCIIIDNNKFYVLENGEKIYESEVNYILESDYIFVNNAVFDIDENLLTLYRHTYKKQADYSYSYKDNRLCKLKDK